MNQLLGISMQPGLRGPYARGFWTYDHTLWATLICLVPPLAVTLWNGGIDVLWLLWLSLLTVIIWQAVFAARRGRTQRRDVLMTAVIFTIVAGGEVSLLRAALGLSFGITLGELVFGGRAFGFLNPVVVAMSFLLFAFPTETISPASEWLAYASLPGVIFLLFTRLLSCRLFSGLLIGVFGAGYFTQPSFDATWLLQGHLLFAAIFLACDPASTTCTNAGRWVNGFLTGFLALVFTPSDAASIEVQALMPAILLSSIFAPLIDRLVIEANIAIRERRHG